METERAIAEATKRDATAVAASSGANADYDETPAWVKEAEPQHKRGRKNRDKASSQPPGLPEKDADDKKQASSVAAFGNRRLTDPNDVFSHNAWYDLDVRTAAVDVSRW